MTIKVCLAGASGWVGKALLPHLLNSKEFTLVSATARSIAGKDAATSIGLAPCGVLVSASLSEALLAKPDVLIDYTHAGVIYQHMSLALDQGVHCIVGTSGLTKEQLDELGSKAQKKNVGIFAAGNFAITAALLQHLALIAAKFVPTWELIDYGKPSFVHAPSATARELADKLAEVRRPVYDTPVSEVFGLKEARGAEVSGTQIHSIRSPGFTFSVDAIFGLKGERLILKHEASESAEPYVMGTLLAAKQVCTFTGLRRGMESILFKDCAY